MRYVYRNRVTCKAEGAIANGLVDEMGRVFLQAALIKGKLAMAAPQAHGSNTTMHLSLEQVPAAVRNQRLQPNSCPAFPGDCTQPSASTSNVDTNGPGGVSTAELVMHDTVHAEDFSERSTRSEEGTTWAEETVLLGKRYVLSHRAKKAGLYVEARAALGFWLFTNSSKNKNGLWPPKDTLCMLLSRA